MGKILTVLLIYSFFWVIYLRNGEEIKARELVGNQWASQSILVYIDWDGNKTYINWSDVQKVVEHKD